MTEPIERFHDIKTDNTDFQTQIDAILDRGLTPENLKTYAEDALNDLIATIGSIEEAYSQRLPVGLNSSKEREDAGLECFGIEPSVIETTLNYIADLDEKIREKVAFVQANSSVGKRVIVQTDGKVRSSIAVGDGSFKEQEIVLRMETILQLLESHYRVIVKDEKEAEEGDDRFIHGAVDSAMMRKIPYDIIDSPTLNRIIMVCNERGNRSFIFDREKIASIGLNIEDLKSMTKDELDELIAQNQAIGRAIIYSERFVGDMEASIDEISCDVTTSKEMSILRPLLERMPAEAISIIDFAEKLNISVTTLTNWCQEFQVTIGQIDHVKSARSGKPTRILSQEQQAFLLNLHRERFAGHVDETPQGYLTVKEYAEKRNIAWSTMNIYIKKSESELGEVLKLRRTSAGSAIRILSQDQQAVLDKKYPDTFKSPLDGEKTVEEFARDVGRTVDAVRHWIMKEKQTLGIIKRGKRQSVILSQNQQDLLSINYVVGSEEVVDEIPANSITLTELSELLQLTEGAVRKHIRDHRDALGRILKVKQSIGRPQSVFTYSQRDMLLRFREQERDNCEVDELPDGYETLADFAIRTGIKKTTLQHWAKNRTGELGEIKKLKRVTGGLGSIILSPDQQSIMAKFERIRMQRMGKSAVISSNTTT